MSQSWILIDGIGKFNYNNFDTMIVKASFVQYARGALCSIVLSLKSDSASDGPV